MSDDLYLIAGTDTLRNTRGITEAAALARYETRVSIARIAQLERGEVRLAGSWDLRHLLDHHRHIFQDVYSWAGEPRATNLYKGATEFCRASAIPDFAAQVFGDLAAADHLRGLDRAEFVAGAAHLLSEVNMLHPGPRGQRQGSACVPVEPGPPSRMAPRLDPGRPRSQPRSRDRGLRR